MNLQPTLLGRLLTLRPLIPNDLENLYAAASDPLIWEQHPKSNRHQRPIFEAFFKEALDSQGALVVVDNASGKLIGSSRYYNYDSSKNEVTIGATFLARSYWGGEFNGEMKNLMIRHAFQFVDVIEFHVDDKNFRSQKALAKIGVQYSHTIETALENGAGKKTRIYVLRKSEAAKQSRFC